MGIEERQGTLRLRRQQSIRTVLRSALAAMVAAVLGLWIVSERAQGQAATTFSGDAALVLHFVKPASTAIYEAVMARTGEALRKRGNAETDRRAGWSVYRANVDISGQDSAMYAWVIDPVIDGAEYSASAILTEAFPADVEQLREVYDESLKDAPLQQLPINLELIESQPTNTTGDHVTLLLHFVKRAAAPMYESVVQGLGEASRGSGPRTVPQLQPLGWRAFRAVHNISGRDDAMYVWFIEPAMEQAGDAVTRIMTDLLAMKEFRTLSQTYQNSLADSERNQLRIDLRLIAAFGAQLADLSDGLRLR